MFTTILFMICSLLVSAQEKTTADGNKKITGVVLGSDGLPIPGAKVIIEETSKAVETDFDGKYTIEAKVGEKVIFSYVEMKTQYVTVGTSNYINITFDDNTPQDCSKQAYRTTTKDTCNVAIIPCTGGATGNIPNTDFLRSLQEDANAMTKKEKSKLKRESKKLEKEQKTVTN